jgi:DNA-binding transcriptional ArsR family regulator
MLHQSVALDRLFLALADPTRRVMVERLSRGPASVSALARPLAISLPAVLQHLQILETSGLVRTEKIGRGALWERRFDRLGAALSELRQTTPTT